MIIKVDFIQQVEKMVLCNKHKSRFLLVALTFIVSALLIGPLVFAQAIGAVSSGISSGWTRNDIFQNKVFIENKGQFDGKNNQISSQITYGINSRGQQIYFTSTGLTYRYDIREFAGEIESCEKKFASPVEEEKYEKEMMKKITDHTYVVDMQWVNANPMVQLVAENIVPQYYAYGDEKKSYKASAYKKLIYKDLYPNIDVEYVFHKEEGIKYSLILHPGADPSKIQMKYSGADNIYKDKNGNIHIVTALGDIVDHAPFTFYESSRSVISSAFSVNNNTVSFLLNTSNSKQPKTDNQQPTIIIDPWTVGVTLRVSNRALEVERDFAGNVYILGGSDGTTGPSMLLQKFSSAGAFIWQYNPPTVNGRFTGEYGDDLKIDKAGNVYICGGSFGGQTFKVSSAGVTIWSLTQFTEPYRLSIDCDNSTLILTGGLADQNQALFINPTTGVIANSITQIFSSFIGNVSIGDDLRDWVYAPNGNYYGMTIGQSGPGRLFAFSPGMMQMWYVNHGYPLVYWGAAYTGHIAGQPCSLHLIAVSKNFIYTTSGSVLNKRNLATGAIISSVAIPGGVFASNANGNSGIILDTCNNVYVSSQNGVYKYDANLNFISSAATTAAVYDICLGSNPGEILACGNGFLASLNLSACIPAPLNVSATATPTGNCNNGNIGTASASTTGGNPTYNYYWIPGGQTSSSLSGLGAGTYSVIVTDENCNKDTAVVTINPTGAIVTSVTKINLQCNGANNGSATIIASNGAPPYSYLWSNGSTSTTIAGLSANTYTVTVTDNNGCKSVQTVNISQPNPFIIAAITTGTTCNNPNGKAEVNVAASNGPFTYSWSTGSTNYWAGSGSSAYLSSTLSAGTYTVTVRDAYGCTQTTTAAVASSTSPADPSFVQSPVGTVCMGALVNFTHTGSAGTYNWVISPITPANVSGTTTNFSYTFLSVGTYTINHTVTNGGCTNSKTSTVNVINCSAGPTISATGSSVCPGTCAAVTSSATGGSTPYTYSWSNGATTQNISPCPATTTTYTVTIRDTGGNTSTSTAVVTIHPPVTVSTSTSNISCNGNSDGSSTATAGGGGTPAYTYSWSNLVSGSSVSGLSAGNYTVTVTDSKGCISTSTTTIVSPPSLTGQFAKGTAACAGCSCKQWIMINATGGTSPYSYTWPDGYVNRYKNQLCAGAYAIKVVDKNGCSTNLIVNAP